MSGSVILHFCLKGQKSGQLQTKPVPATIYFPVFFWSPDLGPLPAPCVLIPFSSKEPYQQSPLPIPRLRGGGWLVTGESR